MKQMVAPHLEVQAYRIFSACSHWESLRGALRSEGFVYKYAARAEALLQLLVSAWLLPTASKVNEVMLTEFGVEC